MPARFPSDDIIGPVGWDAEYGWWTFEAGLPGGPQIDGTVFPGAGGAPPAGAWLQSIRECVIWLRQNETDLRERVAAAWVGTHRQTLPDAVANPVALAALIRTAEVAFVEGRPADISYDDGGLLGGCGIWVQIDADGRIVRGPDFAS